MTSIVLIGSRGRAGMYHKKIYTELSIKDIKEVDIGVPNTYSSLNELVQKYPLERSVIDVCTPTSTHVEIIRKAYDHGARRFVVEKPAAFNLAEWRKLVEETTDAQYFIIHNYLYSTAFKYARKFIAKNKWKVVNIHSTFSKDRTKDSISNRGVSESGIHPHIFQIEMPHQISLAIAVLGPIEVTNANCYLEILGNQNLPSLGHGMVKAKNLEGSTAELHTNLQGETTRSLIIYRNTGESLQIQFATDINLHSKVTMVTDYSSSKLLFDGYDNSLKNSINCALLTLNKNKDIPWQSSVKFASSILQNIDQAIWQSKIT